jgi:hypothetical protein
MPDPFAPDALCDRLCPSHLRTWYPILALTYHTLPFQFSSIRLSVDLFYL